MRHSQCDLLLTCCTGILRFEDGRIKAQYPMDAAGAEKVKHFFTAKPDAQEEKELTTTKITIIRELKSQSSNPYRVLLWRFCLLFRLPLWG